MKCQAEQETTIEEQTHPDKQQTKTNTSTKLGQNLTMSNGPTRIMKQHLVELIGAFSEVAVLFWCPC